MRSFILTTKINTESLISCMEGIDNVHYVKFDQFLIALFDSGDYNLDVSLQDKNLNNQIIILGQVLNEPEIICLSNNVSQGSLIVDISLAILTLLKIYGSRAIDFIEGNFAILHFTEKGLKLYTNSTPTYTIYYVNQESFWVSNQVKYISRIPSVNSEIIPFAHYNPRFSYEKNFTLFKYIKKVPPKAVLLIPSLDLDSLKINIRKPTTANYGQSPLCLTNTSNFNKIFSTLDHLFSSSLGQIINSFKNTESIAIALSGGVDSSVVASYARTLNPKLKMHCYTTGTESSIEFGYAKRCSDYLGAVYHKIEINQDSLIEDLINMVYQNEMFDAFSLEVYAPLCSIYNASMEHTNILLTGVGADNIMSGYTRDRTDFDGITLLTSERSYWSGAMLPYCAWSKGVIEYSPFLSKRLIAFLQKITPDIKNYNNINKYLLKTLAQKKDFLSEENIWRKKIRLEQGNQTVELLSDFLQITQGDTITKHRFVYEIFKVIFQQKQSLAKLDVREILSVIRS